jgi:hypothetical protein
VIVWLARAPWQRREMPADRKVRAIADVVATWRAVAGNRVITSMVVLVGCASLIVGNAYQAQMPEFAHDLGHPDGGITYSALLGADAAGALAAGPDSRGARPAAAEPAHRSRARHPLVRRDRRLRAGELLSARAGSAFAAGFLELAFFAMAQTLVQVNAPAQVRGRVIGLFAMSALGLRAFSGLTVGLGGSVIGIHWSLAISAAVLLVITALFLALRPS